MDEAHEELKGRIVSNRMPAECQSPESHLATSLGMSRTPVREALIRLETEGLVEPIPRRGFRGLPVTAIDVLEAYDILSVLEPFAVTQLCKRKLDRDVLQDIESAVRRMETAANEQNPQEWDQAELDFHIKVLRTLGNRKLIQMLLGLYDHVHRARMFSLHLRDDIVESTRAQRAVMDAIVSGDPELAERLLRDHRERVAQNLTEILTRFQIAQM